MYIHIQQKIFKIARFLNDINLICIINILFRIIILHVVLKLNKMLLNNKNKETLNNS